MNNGHDAILHIVYKERPKYHRGYLVELRF
jgi:hypothetical protein